MIKARDLIKKSKIFEFDDDYRRSLKSACIAVAADFYKVKYNNKTKELDDNVPEQRIKLSAMLYEKNNKIMKLSKRLEREFLRGEKEAKKQELGQNETLLKVRVIDFKDDINRIEEIKLHVTDGYYVAVKFRLTEWIFNTRPFDKNGLYMIKGVLNEYDDGLSSDRFWDFKLIDFKPLEVESDY